LILSYRLAFFLLHGVAVSQTKTQDANGLQPKKRIFTNLKKIGQDFSFKSIGQSPKIKRKKITSFFFFLFARCTRHF